MRTQHQLYLNYGLLFSWLCNVCDSCQVAEHKGFREVNRIWKQPYEKSMRMKIEIIIENKLEKFI